MWILAFLTNPFTVNGIATSNFPPFRHPSPQRAPPPPGEPADDADPLLDPDQTPAFAPTDPEPIPDFDFDQSLGA